MKAKKAVKKAVKKPVAKKVAPKADKRKKAAKPVQKKVAPKKVAKKPVKKADKPLVKNKVFNVSGHNILERTVGRKKVYEVYQNGKFIDKANSLYGAEHIADARHSNQIKQDTKPSARNEKMLFGIMKDGSDVREVRIYKKVPKGWKVTEGTMTDPIGYKWIDNKKSLFAKDKNGKPVRKTAFIERDWHKKMSVAEKNDLHREHPVVIIDKSGKKVTFGKVKKAGKTK